MQAISNQLYTSWSNLITPPWKGRLRDTCSFTSFPHPLTQSGIVHSFSSQLTLVYKNIGGKEKAFLERIPRRKKQSQLNLSFKIKSGPSEDLKKVTALLQIFTGYN